MAMEGIHNVPQFKYDPRIKESAGNPKDREREKEEEQGKKKKQDNKKEALFESLADSLSQYGDEPFQFSG